MMPHFATPRTHITALLHHRQYLELQTFCLLAFPSTAGPAISSVQPSPCPPPWLWTYSFNNGTYCNGWFRGNYSLRPGHGILLSPQQARLILQLAQVCSTNGYKEKLVPESDLQVIKGKVCSEGTEIVQKICLYKMQQ